MCIVGRFSPITVDTYIIKEVAPLEDGRRKAFLLSELQVKTDTDGETCLFLDRIDRIVEPRTYQLTPIEHPMAPVFLAPGLSLGCQHVNSVTGILSAELCQVYLSIA